MKKYMLAAVLASLASPAMAEPVMIDLGPEMTCYINDNDPPSNIRTQPNGVVVGHLYNGTVVVPADRMRANSGSYGMWDFVQTIDKQTGKAVNEGWVFEALISCGTK
jgi:hypothetical protein